MRMNIEVPNNNPNPELVPLTSIRRMYYLITKNRILNEINHTADILLTVWFFDYHQAADGLSAAVNIDLSLCVWAVDHKTKPFLRNDELAASHEMVP